MDSDLGREATVGKDGLHNPSNEGCTVQGAILLGHRDVGVDQWLLLDDVVRLIVIVGLLQLVSLLAKQCPPHRYLQRLYFSLILQM